MSIPAGLLKKTLWITALGAAFASAALAHDARHVILFVGDGMNMEHEIATSRYFYGGDRKLSSQRLPYRGKVAICDVTSYKL
jgi:alkaline phosphatase